MTDIELKSISIVSVQYYLSDIKKQVYDNDKDKALATIELLTKLIDSSEIKHCERCNCQLSNEDYAMAGELCESCCLALGCHNESED